MNSNDFLIAAYVVTWALHIGYILYLTSRTKRLREDVRELERTSQNQKIGSR